MSQTSKDFQRRSCIFYRLLKGGSYPNKGDLARVAGCSESTAKRVISCLQDQYAFPIRYDCAKHGYYLTDPTFTYSLPTADQEELNVLLLLRSLASHSGMEGIARELDCLWDKLVGPRPRLAKDAQSFAEKFSCDSTEATLVKQSYLLPLLSAAKDGSCLTFLYNSPWRQQEAKRYIVRVERVRLLNAALYVLAQTHDGKLRVFNCGFLQELQVLDDPPSFSPLQEGEEANAHPFHSSFGIWSGEEVIEISVTIASPAARFYAAQIWHPAQQDAFSGEALTRTFPSILSPELLRRLLSLAPHLLAVEPEEVRERLRQRLNAQLSLLAEGGGTHSEPPF